MEEIATLGGGCFWCIEAVFNQVQGVISAISGYAGGNHPNPSYEQVCKGTTGHAEVVQITFDNEEISYQELLEIFLSVHDPTTLNRQGNDVGTQYRSIILTHSKEQEKIAKDTIAKFEEMKIWDNPIVTEIRPIDKFYRAEEYHQRYFEKNPTQAYCQAVVAPKVAKFRKKFSHRLKQ